MLKINSSLISAFFDPALFNPMSILAVGFAIHIEAAVEYLKKEWMLPGQAAPYAASILSALVQIGICVVFKIPVTATLAGTIATTAVACWWHELSS